MAQFRTARPRWRFMAASLLLLTALTGCELHIGPPADPSAAHSQLDQLTVTGAGSMRGYSRARFSHWQQTGGNCDVRDTVLRRDGEDIRLRGCNVVGGRWFSPYDGAVHTDPSDVDIDHLVPLANAWRSGAANWTDERRAEFANDRGTPQLIAVSAGVNRSKGDQDPSQWKPPRRSAWCDYALDWVAVKSHWQLTVTAAEKDALIDMLETCAWPTTSP